MLSGLNFEATGGSVVRYYLSSFKGSEPSCCKHGQGSLVLNIFFIGMRVESENEAMTWRLNAETLK